MCVCVCVRVPMLQEAVGRLLGHNRQGIASKTHVQAPARFHLAQRLVAQGCCGYVHSVHTHQRRLGFTECGCARKSAPKFVIRMYRLCRKVYSPPGSFACVNAVQMVRTGFDTTWFFHTWLFLLCAQANRCFGLVKSDVGGEHRSAVFCPCIQFARASNAADARSNVVRGGARLPLNGEQ